MAVSEETLAEVVRRVALALHPDAIYLFGSRARGEADENSDVDLLVVVPKATGPVRELARRGRRSLWGMGIPVDLVVCTAAEVEKWSRVGCNLIHTAVEKGRQVYAA